MVKLHIDDIINSPLNKPRQEMKVKDIFSTDGEWKTQSLKVDSQSRSKEKSGMNIHIELTKDEGGNTMTVIADIENKEDLETFNEIYKKYLPRKKLFGIF